MNRWIGHRLVEFGSDMCQKCGNERLRHLHRIQTEDGIIEVGCVCAARLCEDQQEDIKTAERLMSRQDMKLKRLNDLKASWKQSRSKGSVKRVTGMYDNRELTVRWALGQGWTIDMPNAPLCPGPRGWEHVQQWVEHYFELSEATIGR